MATYSYTISQNYMPSSANNYTSTVNILTKCTDDYNQTEKAENEATGNEDIINALFECFTNANIDTGAGNSGGLRACAYNVKTIITGYKEAVTDLKGKINQNRNDVATQFINHNKSGDSSVWFHSQSTDTRTNEGKTQTRAVYKYYKKISLSGKGSDEDTVNGTWIDN